ncbi:hypothetical protein D9M68_666970 [compost metagenome]
MAFFVRDCVRCGVRNVSHLLIGQNQQKESTYEWEVAGACAACSKVSVYSLRMKSSGTSPSNYPGVIPDDLIAQDAVRIATTAMQLSEYVPERIAGLFREANECRQMGWYDAAGAMFRKTLDVATKHIYAHDARLVDKEPAQALRVRIKSLGEMKILESDIVELADVAALDGNDATHDVDPYTKGEAEALEDLTLDLLDRLFVRPAKIAAVKAKQIAAGVRKT